jgi:hypothetical protein
MILGANGIRVFSNQQELRNASAELAQANFYKAQVLTERALDELLTQTNQKSSSTVSLDTLARVSQSTLGIQLDRVA